MTTRTICSRSNLLCHTYVEDNCTRHVGSQDLKDVTRYGLGARGIDFMQAKTEIVMGSGGSESGGTLQDASFPLYDAHGDMVNTLSRASGGSFALGNSSFRYYDAWGSWDAGPGADNEPRQRYCANLGHLQDDESGLIYMRAQYYEPGTGRFVSEEPELLDCTAFSYAANNPVALVDSTGKGPDAEIAAILTNALLYLSKVYTKDTIVTVGNSLISQLKHIAACQRARAEDQFEMARIASASGNVEAARTFQSLGTKSMAFAVVADLGVWQIRCMMAIAEQVIDMGLP